MSNFPGGCTSGKQFSNYVHERVRDCILRYMSKEDTAIHLRDRYQITNGITKLAWCNIEKLNPEFFKTYFEDGIPNATARAKLSKGTVFAKSNEETGSYKTAPNLPPKGGSGKAPSLFSDTRAREKQQMETARKVLSQVPKEGESQARQKQTVQASPQQTVYPTVGFWQKLETTLGQIQSNTDQMVKLMKHPSATGSSFKRQRVEQEKERCDNDEAEKLQNQNSQLPKEEDTHGKSRGNKAAKID